MAKKFTDVIIILDKSGSMHELTEDTIGGFNSLIEQQKQENSDSDVFVTTILFNEKVKLVHDFAPIGEVPKLTTKEYVANGSTALYDAVGFAIKHEDERILSLAKKKKPLPNKTLIVITTDGYENASVKYKYEEIRELIEKRKEEGVNFLFIRANIDSDAFAEKIGVGSDYAFTVEKNSSGMKNMMSSVCDCIALCREEANDIEIKKYIKKIKK